MGVDPNEVTGNGSPEKPYKIRLDYNGEKDCQAITSCLRNSVGAGTFLAFDDLTNKLTISFGSVYGCNGMADCIGKFRLGKGLAYNETTKLLSVTVSNCDTTVKCVQDNLAQLIAPGNNQIKVKPAPVPDPNKIGATLHIAKGIADNRWDCTKTVDCITARLGNGLEVVGGKIKVKPILADGITATATGVGIKPGTNGGLTIAGGGLNIKEAVNGGLNPGATAGESIKTGVGFKTDGNGLGLDLDPKGGIKNTPGKGLGFDCDRVTACGGGGDAGGDEHYGHGQFSGGYTATNNIPSTPWSNTGPRNNNSLKVQLAVDANPGAVGCALSPDGRTITLQREGLWRVSVSWRYEGECFDSGTARPPITVYTEIIGSGHPIVGTQFGYCMSGAQYGNHITSIIRVPKGGTKTIQAAIWTHSQSSLPPEKANLSKCTVQAVRVHET